MPKAANAVYLELEGRGQTLAGGFADGDEREDDGTLIRCLFPEMDRVMGLGSERKGTLLLREMIDIGGREDEGYAADRDGVEGLEGRERVGRVQIGPTPDLVSVFEAARLVGGFDVDRLIHFREGEVIEEEDDGAGGQGAPLGGMRAR